MLSRCDKGENHCYRVSDLAVLCIPPRDTETGGPTRLLAQLAGRWGPSHLQMRGVGGYASDLENEVARLKAVLGGGRGHCHPRNSCPH
jgi:hypothetical protein